MTTSHSIFRGDAPGSSLPARYSNKLPRLQEIVESSSRSENLIDECLIELREFVGSDWEQEDDITLVTLKRTTSEGS
jgi:serine phosphatase RsbU (regulator of sigma subunit)